MARRTVVLTGDRALNRKLQRLRGPVAKKVIRQASRKALKPVVAEVKRRAPVASGKLRRSVTVRAQKRSRRSVGTRVTTKTGLFGGETFYGGFLELGTKFHRAMGFVKAASIVRRREALAIYRREIASGIRRVASGI